MKRKTKLSLKYVSLFSFYYMRTRLFRLDVHSHFYAYLFCLSHRQSFLASKLKIIYFRIFRILFTIHKMLDQFPLNFIWKGHFQKVFPLLPLFTISQFLFCALRENNNMPYFQKQDKSWKLVKKLIVISTMFCRYSSNV